MSPTPLDWVVAGVLGGLVSAGELVSRYRDAPSRALVTVAALFYIALNVAASVTALALSFLFGWTFGASGAAVEWTQVLVAGFGALALFRSSLFTVHIADQDVAVGPAAFLQIVLTAADSAVDRTRAQARAISVGGIMADVSWTKARVELPALSLALMQNLSKDDQQALASQIAALDGVSMNDNVKALTLGLAVDHFLGEGVLRAAVTQLGAQIKDDPKPT